jgi:hypothetical protein
MANTVKLAPQLYSAMPRTGIPGMKSDYRSCALLTTDLITTQIVAIGILPAMHLLVGFFLESDQLDTGTGITITVGLLNSYWNYPLASGTVAGWDSGSSPVLATGYNIIAANTIGQTGGRVSNTTLEYTQKIGIDNLHDRIIGVQFAAVPTTAQAGNIYSIALIDMPYTTLASV